MILLALVIGGVGLVLLCRLAVLLAIHAGPLFAGAAVGVAVHAHGAGLPTAIALGALAAVAVLAAGHLMMASVRAPVLRMGLAALFVIPAAVAGYHLAHGLAAPLGVSGVGRQLASFLAAVLVAAVAWMRLPRPRPGRGADPSFPPDPARPPVGEPPLAQGRR